MNIHVTQSLIIPKDYHTYKIKLIKPRHKIATIYKWWDSQLNVSRFQRWHVATSSDHCFNIIWFKFMLHIKEIVGLIQGRHAEDLPRITSSCQEIRIVWYFSVLVSYHVCLSVSWMLAKSIGQLGQCVIVIRI